MMEQGYKRLTMREFTAAAEKFDNNPSVYNLCRKEYPDLLAELTREPCRDVLDCGCGGASGCTAGAERRGGKAA